MGNYTILYMFENPRRGRQARNFTTNAPKILVLKSSSEQTFSRKLPLGAPDTSSRMANRLFSNVLTNLFNLKYCLNEKLEHRKTSNKTAATKKVRTD